MLLILLTGCASQRPPEGGPPDTEAPFIIGTSPENETVRFTGREITFTFSEYVQRASFQEAVHISPLPVTPPSFKWSGRTARIVFDSSLQENRTYVITVGTKVKDIRAGNAMRETMHLAFSTGDSLDQGTFNGTVYGEPAGGVTLFAYLLDPLRADTLNPAIERPDYAVQSSDDGAFHFYNVVPGPYRVFAVRDKSNDYRYNAESEDIGVPDRDILVEDTTAPPPLRLFLSTEDTTRPHLQRVEALHARLLRLKFNETVYPQPLPLEHIVIRDSATAESVGLQSAVTPAEERFTWDVRLSAPLREVPYLLWIDSLEDGAGNWIDTSAHPWVFVGSATADTARPRILATIPAENARGVEPDSSFRIQFDRPLQGTDAFSLQDSSGTPVALEVQRISPTEIALDHPPLMGEAVYTLCFEEHLLSDSIGGRAVGDSTRCFRFRTDKRDQYGSLSGSVETSDSSGHAVVRLHETGRQPRTRTIATDSSRSFRFEAVPEGQYILDAFIDRNGNRRYDFGKPWPLQRPEPYGRVRDTLRVRARWETDGIRIPLQGRGSVDSTTVR
ncbi:MAG: Ig-like domain-containing protein [Bacteroidetes bacterium]|nr:Ig-like domain-containing protein [Bacteroidota bacterium]